MGKKKSKNIKQWENMKACVFRRATLLRFAKPLAEVWVMICAHKQLCYQLVQLRWSILTTQAGVNHASPLRVRKCVCILGSVKVLLASMSSCGKALFLVNQNSRSRTAVCQMRDFHCGLTGNIRVLVRASRDTETLPSWRQNKNTS